MADTLVRLFEEFQRYDADIKIQTIVVFLLIAGKPSIRLKDLEKATGLSGSAVARNVQALGDRSWKRGPTGEFLPGLKWVMTVTDPTDTRAKVTSLTVLGRRIFERVQYLFNSR